MLVRTLVLLIVAVLALCALHSSDEQRMRIGQHAVRGWEFNNVASPDRALNRPPQRPVMLLAPWCPLGPRAPADGLDHT